MLAIMYKQYLQYAINLGVKSMFKYMTLTTDPVTGSKLERAL